MTKYTLDVEGAIWSINACDLDHLMVLIARTFTGEWRVEIIAAEQVR